MQNAQFHDMKGIWNDRKAFLLLTQAEKNLKLLFMT